MSGRFVCCRCMSAATVIWDESASCGRRRVVGMGVKAGEGLLSCGIVLGGWRRGGVWMSVGDSGCCGDVVGESGVWRSGVG